ncbi:hypothetical protein F2Q68_00010673 [Brassica cretica]|uniref:C2 domain-containing protein n=1 Tax=Brassica cretica TaxID=69181 RepID=A0A8S9KVV3_BRACR|nr:hypothetical protein F2Q68_00010673 [Brassica cretica]
MAKATIFLSDLKTGRVRHSRRRKEAATEERRIKAMRDQPCPATLIPVFIVFPLTIDWVLCFTLISLGVIRTFDCQDSLQLMRSMYEFQEFLKPSVRRTAGKQKLQTTVVNSNLNPVWNQELMMSVPKSYGPVKLTTFDTFFADDIMGEAQLDIQPLITFSADDINYDTFSADDIMGEAQLDIQPLVTSAMAFGDP